jgi:hypothetical protein
VAIAMVALFWILRKSNEATIHAANRFATAVVHNDPGAAPDGGGDYVGGVRAYFGPVSAARVIDSHNHSVNTGDSADTRSYYVGDILLSTRRGPAVIELEFDNASLANASQRISSIHELAPDKVRRNKLSSADRDALEAAFAQRGSKAADEIALNGALAELPAATAPTHSAPAAPPPAVGAATKRRQRAAAQRLHCVQRAHGDVTKLQRCVS